VHHFDANAGYPFISKEKNLTIKLLFGTNSLRGKRSPEGRIDSLGNYERRGAIENTQSSDYSDWCAMVCHYPTAPQSTPMLWTLALTSDTIRCNDASSLPSVKNTGYRVRVVHYGVLLSRIAGSRELGVAGEKREQWLLLARTCTSCWCHSLTHRHPCCAQQLASNVSGVCYGIRT
jgi:hypothetical protein